MCAITGVIMTAMPSWKRFGWFAEYTVTNFVNGTVRISNISSKGFDCLTDA